MKEEYIKYGDGRKCRELMSKYPEYSVYWQSGWGWKGASPHLLDKQDPNFEEIMQQNYNWAANICITVNHDKQSLNFNGLSCCDME